MATVTLSAYKFQFTRYNKETGNTEYYAVNNIVNNKSALDIITEFCNEYSDYESDESEKCVFKSSILKKFEEADNADENINFSAIMGRVNSGEWGYTRDIVNPTNGDVVYTKPKNYADVIPFLFAVALPYEEDRDKTSVTGIAMFQNLGVYGIKTEFFTLFRKYLNDKYKNITLEISALCPEFFAQHLIDSGYFKEIKLIKNLITADTANELGLSTGDGYVVWDFKRIGGITDVKKKKLKDFVTGKIDNLHEIIQIPDFSYDNIKFVIQKGKKTTTMSLNNLSNLNVGEEVSNEALGDDGHPDPDVLKEYFTQMYKDYSPYVKFKLRD